MSDFKLAPLAGPSVEIQGVNTSVPKSYLGKGEVENAVNLRSKRGWVARDGIAEIGPDTPFATGTYRGSAHAILNGTDLLLVARRESSQTLVYSSENDGVTWYEITDNDSGGPYGVTRFPTDGFVTFAVVKDRGNQDIDESDCLILQNGTDAPRVYALDKEDAFGTPSAYVMATAPDPTTPETTLWLDRYFAGTGFPCNDSGEFTATNSGSDFTVSDSGDSSIAVEAKDGTIDGDTAAAAITGITWEPMDWSNLKQAILVVKDLVSDPLFVNVDFEIGDGSNWDTLFSAGELFYKCAVAFTDDEKDGFRTAQIGMPLPEEPASDLSVVDRFRLTWKGGTVATPVYFEAEAFDVAGDNTIQRTGANWGINQWAGYWVRITADPTTPASIGQYRQIVSNDKDTLTITPDWDTNPSGEAVFQIVDRPRIAYIEALVGAGSAFGGTDFALSFANSGTRAEGAATICTIKKTTFGYGVGATPDIPSPLVDSRFYFNYDLHYTKPTASSLNVARFYTNELGVQDDYSYIAELPISRWAMGVWENDSTVSQFFYDGQTQDLIDILPDNTTGVPVGTAMSAMNERLFVASGARVWYSRFQRPFAFTKYQIAGDDLSSSSFATDGEQVQAFAALGSVPSGAETLGSPQIGACTLYIVTDKTLNQVSGWDASSLNRRTVLAPYGTRYPRSLAITRSGLIYVSSEGQVVAADNGQTRLLTWNRIDASLHPGSPIMDGAWVRDKYYLLVSQTVIAVYDEPQDVWLFDTADYKGFLPYKGQTAKLYAWSDSTLYEHEQVGKAGDLETGYIPVSLAFREVNAPEGKTMESNSLIVECDQSDTGGLEFTLSGRDKDAITPSVGTMSLAGSGDRILRMPVTSDGDWPGVAANNLTVAMEGDVPSGWAIHSVNLQIRMQEGAGPDVLAAS